MFICYLVENLTNKKKYVGITSGSFANRWIKHCSSAASGSPFLLHKAIRKYGRDNFSHAILHQDVAPDMICDIEAQSIIEYNTLCTIGHGYNMTTGGEGCSSVVRGPMSESTKQKIREANLGKHSGPRSPETIQRIKDGVARNPGPRHTTPHTDETRQKLRDCNLGKKLSLETRRKMSESRKGMKQSPEVIAQKTGVAKSEETRRKMSESKRARDQAKKDNTR